MLPRRASPSSAPGLMGHGIAQVFALAGHDVTITDTVREKSRHREVAHRRESARSRRRRARGRARRAVAPISPRRCATPITSSRRCWKILPLKQKLFAEIERHVRRRHHPRQQYVGDSDHRDHAGLEHARARARHPLVESAVPGAAGRSDRNAVDVAAGGRLDHGTAPARRQEARACQEGRAGLHRQPAAACAVARGDLAGRARHLRRRDGRCRDQGVVRPPYRGARPARKCRSRRHRSDACDPRHGAAGDRQPARRRRPICKSLCRRQAWVQIGRRLPQMERRRAGRARAPRSWRI